MTDRRLDDLAFTLLEAPDLPRPPANWPSKAEPIQLLEIDQQFCGLEYGTSPCTADVGTTGTRKCYNTFSTCQDKDNYEPNGIALEADGTGDAESTNNTFEATGDWTIDCLFLVRTSTGSVIRWNTQQTNNENALAIAIGGDDALRLEVTQSDGTGKFFDIIGAGDLIHDTTYHLLLQKEGPFVQTYVNGAFAAKAGAVGFGGGDFVGNFGGGTFEAPVEGFDGRVAHIRIWGRALSAEERQRVTGSQLGSVTDGIEHHWPVRRRADFTAAADDLEGNANIDVVTGATFGSGLLAEPLTLRFARNQSGLDIYDGVIPSVSGIDTTPLKVNLGGMDDGVSPFGRREMVRVTLEDHAYSDRLVDKYVDERPTGDAGDVVTPRNAGTFWSKWIARNPFFNGFQARIREGYLGQSIDEMPVRHYIMDGVSGPTEEGVQLRLADVFSLAEKRRAQAPRASRAVLNAALPSSETTSFTVDITDDEILDRDYPVTTGGRVRIGNEIIISDRSGNTFTITERGADGTEIDDHDADDSVQFCERFEGDSAQEIVRRLLVDYVGVLPQQIPLADWDAQNLIFAYTATIAEPTSVSDLIGELAMQAGFSIWPDVRTQKIRLRALEPTSADIEVVRDRGAIIEGSYTSVREDEKRTSQVWVYFGQRDPTQPLDDVNNYRVTFVAADLQSESENEYGSSSVKQIFSRWVQVRAAASSAGNRILSLFRDPPTRSSFSLDICLRDRLRLTSPFRLDVIDQSDDIGFPRVDRFAPVSIRNNETSIDIQSQQVRFFAVPDEERVLNIDENEGAVDYNIREQHDLAFTTPIASGDTVRVVIAPGVVVGASDNQTPAFQTGTWPAGVTLIVEQRNGAIISGYAGNGGRGGSHVGDAEDGEDGGLAVRAEYAVAWENLGTIQGGGGGGGGGGGAQAFSAGVPVFNIASGGGGGGAAGRQGRQGGESPDLGGDEARSGEDGTDGTFIAGGLGGDGGIQKRSGSTATGGAGGDGGDPAEVGQPGAAASFTPGGAVTAPGSGGSAGAAIEGDSFITFAPEGTITGARSA